MHRGGAATTIVDIQYSCVFTSCTVYYTPFPVVRLARDDAGEGETVMAVVGNGGGLEPATLVSLDFGNKQASTFWQLLNEGKHVVLPASPLCLGLTTNASRSLCCTVLVEKTSNPPVPTSTAFVYSFGDGEAPRLNGRLASCHSCDFHRDKLWCLSQTKQGVKGGVLLFSLNDLAGDAQLHVIDDNSAFLGVVPAPISIEAVDVNVAHIFTDHGVLRCDARMKELHWIWQSREHLLSGVGCKRGERIVLASESDAVMVFDVRKAFHAMYEVNVSFPVVLRSSRSGSVVLAASRHQVGVFHVEQLEFLGAFDGPGGVLDATPLVEEKHAVRVVSVTADGCLCDWTMEF
ncbi:hypothetical protein TraAM80_08350 [Trypanosoma rangeli]|uniref:Uncharacterized protein n=1 Tax=Trypanosoma rangeli TaxID=5698 RepID=A0A422N150_TRYRA|nr:uncharacterized protein TraAM80_08350 [Trypanosoma rangeli]RNE99187.1 hypothetical protein TraAM80_08350 [Trypanosoma rangeli]|eukprot:RNE99187.1 hypothetical protein TraAM80_08350 [Trypanosoma rangeli]